MARKILTYATTLLIILIVGQGCFTMIKHPQIDYVDQSTKNLSQQCFGCHENLDQFPYGLNYTSHPEYWSDHQNYGKYFAYPWWWETYWWDVINMANNASDNNNDDYYLPPQIIINVSPWIIPITPAGIDIEPGQGSTKFKTSKKEKEKEKEKSDEKKKPVRRRKPDTK